METEAERIGYMTESEYLATEEASPVKREFLGGLVYAMAGASDSHNNIAMNLYRMLGTQLRGRRCAPFGTDMKLFMRSSGGRKPPHFPYYYYPDAMIACDPTDNASGIRERPSALFEIISESTRNVDEREKCSMYHLLPSLDAYVRIEQGKPEVALEHLLPDGWMVERITGLDGVVHLPSLEIELPLAELYERVDFPS